MRDHREKLPCMLLGTPDVQHDRPKGSDGVVGFLGD